MSDTIPHAPSVLSPKRELMEKTPDDPNSLPRVVSWVLALLSGVLAALAFEPFSLRILMPLAPLGCFIAIRYAPAPWGAFWRASLFGIIFYLTSLFWLTEIHPFMPSPELSYLGILLITAYLALYLGVIGYLINRFFAWLTPGLQYLMFACLWVLMEWFRSKGMLACPLSHLCQAWSGWPMMIQLASIFGQFGVTMLILLIGGLVYGWGRLMIRIVARRSAKVPAGLRAQIIRREFLRLTGATILLILVIAWSAYSFHHWQGLARSLGETNGEAPVRSALVQPNIPQRTKHASYRDPSLDYRRRLFEETTQLQEKMLQEIKPGVWDLVVLPEFTFLHPDFYSDADFHERIASSVRKVQAPVVFGANYIEHTEDSRKYYNAAYLFDQLGNLSDQFYLKIRLVPFGETASIFKNIPKIYKFFKLPALLAGTELMLYPCGEYRYGPLICFDAIFSDPPLSMARMGADFFVLLSNDAWYGKSSGASYLNYITALRAVETRRYVLRCANTGISSVHDPSGEMIASLGVDVPGILETSIWPGYARETKTLFMVWQNHWMWGLGLVLLLGRLADRRVRHRFLTTPPEEKSDEETALEGEL